MSRTWYVQLTFRVSRGQIEQQVADVVVNLTQSSGSIIGLAVHASHNTNLLFRVDSSIGVVSEHVSGVIDLTVACQHVSRSHNHMVCELTWQSELPSVEHIRRKGTNITFNAQPA